MIKIKLKLAREVALDIQTWNIGNILKRLRLPAVNCVGCKRKNIIRHEIDEYYEWLGQDF